MAYQVWLTALFLEVVLVSQPCPTLCNPMDCSPARLLCLLNSPGENSGVGSHSPLQGIFLTRNWTGVSCISGGFFTSWATKEAHSLPYFIFNYGLVVALVPLSASDVFYPHISRNMMSKSCPPTAPLGSSDNLGPCLAQTECLGLSVGTWAGRDRPTERYRKWSSFRGLLSVSLTRIQCFVLFCFVCLLLVPVLDPWSIMPTLYPHCQAVFSSRETLVLMLSVHL